MCVCTRGRAAACASLEYFDLFLFSFFFLWKLKRPRKHRVLFVLRAGSCGPRAPLFPPLFPISSPPQISTAAAALDIWEQFFKCACKGCQGINLISRWGAGKKKKKKQLPPRIQHNLPIKTSLSVWQTSINNISSVQIR